MNFRKPLQQEMVQVGPYSDALDDLLLGLILRCKFQIVQSMLKLFTNNATPSLWRTSPGQRDPQSPTPERKVIGASYSHADTLKLDKLSLNPDSRPRTPSTTVTRHKSTPPPTRTTSHSFTPPRRTFTGFLSDTGSAWTASDDIDGEQQPGYDNDEDEFGLPSISSMGRKWNSSLSKQNSRTKQRSTVEEMRSPERKVPQAPWATDNGDVAEERAIPAYPITRKRDGKILRPQYREILRDPANTMHLISHEPPSPNATAQEVEAHSARITRINKFKRILQASTVNMTELRNLAWSGLPSEVRAMSWKLLLGYLSPSGERRVATLERKRKEYLDGVRQAFERGGAAGDLAPDPGSASSPRLTRGKSRGLDEAIWHQISIDVPRTNPHLELYGYEATQRSLERILYVWAIRHPASGYVQGINDLVTPFWQVFLGQYITDPDVESGMDPGQLPKAVLDAVEADSFWCLTKLLEGIQDNYIHAQPGIQRQVSALRDLTARIDGALAKHMENQGVEFIQFSFRWMNCLLMREISVQNTIRMWDTYLAEDQGFSAFHLYVCAAFLVKWSEKLQRMDFQEIMMFLQSLPTRSWTEKDIELLLSEAFIWKSLFAGSQAHVRQLSGGTPAVLNL